MEEKNLLTEIQELRLRIDDLEKKSRERGIKNFFRKSLSKMNVAAGIIITITGTSFILYAAQVMFSEGDLIVAEDVNANFSELFNSVNNLQNKNNSLENDINTVISQIENNIISLEEELAAIGSDISSNASLIANLLPVGTILAWHKSIEGTPGLPPGWEECSGQTMWDDDSPYWGRTLPDLNNPRNPWNSRGLFLRGDVVSGIYEEDAFQGHGHDIAHSGARNYQFHVDNGGEQEEDVESTGDDDDMKYYLNELAEDLSATFPEAYSGYGSPRYSSETRPVSMSVVWIIKVK